MTASSNRELTLVVLLFKHADQTAEFEEFESKAAEIMHRHGGRIEHRVSFLPHDDPSQPDEVHIVTFPHAEAFGRYRDDPAARALAPLRARAIRQTIVWSGSDAPPFQGPEGS